MRAHCYDGFPRRSSEQQSAGNHVMVDWTGQKQSPGAKEEAESVVAVSKALVDNDNDG